AAVLETVRGLRAEICRAVPGVTISQISVSPRRAGRPNFGRMTRQPFQHDALSGYATCPAPGTIRLERRYPATPAELWSWLTDPAKRRLWWAAGRIELHRGGAVELGWRFRELSPSEPVPAEFDLGTGGLFLFGRVTRIEPVHLL